MGTFLTEIKIAYTAITTRTYTLHFLWDGRTGGIMSSPARYYRFGNQRPM